MKCKKSAQSSLRHGNELGIKYSGLASMIGFKSLDNRLFRGLTTNVRKNIQKLLSEIYSFSELDIYNDNFS